MSATPNPSPHKAPASAGPHPAAPLSTTRRLALLAPLALFAAFLLVVTYGLRHDPKTVVRSALIGHPVPAFDLPGYDATHPGLASADLAHGGVTLVNIFASWCLPCRVESPELKALADKGIPVHAIAIRDTPADLGAFFANYGNPYRRIGLDTGGKAQIAWGSSGVPETFVVDGRGIVRHQHVGEIRADELPEMLAEIEKARS